MGVLVTGGTGFIGSYVVKMLVEEGEIPVVLDIMDFGAYFRDLSSKTRFIKGEVSDYDLLVKTIRENKIDRVVHLAALLQFGCESNPKKAVEVNIQGALNVLEACRTAGVKKLVFASSGAAYGSLLGVINESSPIMPDVSLYGATKFMAEVLMERYYRVHKLPFVALRYWGVYGPGEVRSPGMAEVFKKIESTISGKDVVIEAVGPEEHRHFTFVKDAARAAVTALKAENNNKRVFNIAGTEDNYVTFARFHQTFKDLHPSAGQCVFKGKGQDRGKIDITAAEKELGFIPEYTLEKGIKEDIEFYLSHQV